MKILLTGAQGMLAGAIKPVLEAHGHLLASFSRTGLDIRDPMAVKTTMKEVRPDLVLNMAAYTRVDDAESEPQQAFAINAQAVHTLAETCAGLNATLLHVSTDYVFDGQAQQPYPENAPPDPINTYGRSKWAGEQAIRDALQNHYIIRTAWLYGTGGPNFVDTIRKLARRQAPLRVVSDQRGAPTWTHDLSNTICRLILTQKFGTYHISNQGECSWHEVAQKIVALEGLKTPVIPVSSDEFPRPAPRPRYSVLKNQALLDAGIPLLPPWEQSLATYLECHPFAGP